MAALDRLRNAALRARDEARATRAMYRAGAIGGSSPATTAKILRTFAKFGAFGAAGTIAAIRFPDSPAVTDDRGTITWAELDDQVSSLVQALTDRGIKPGARIGVLCRNHRATLILAFAASRAGMDSLWLNTSFSARQAVEVATREGVDLLFHDDEFADVVAGVDVPLGRFGISTDGSRRDELDELIASGTPNPPPKPTRHGRIVLLTSGTTGTPKGAPRPEPRGFVLPGAVLDRLPMRTQETTVIGPPIFHATGMLLTVIAVSLGNHLVLRPRFDAAQMLDDIEQYQASTVCVIPVMMQRMLALGADEIKRRDLSALKGFFTAGSQLPAEVSRQVTEAFGPVIYNLYGSTECSVATFATPDDVREAPTSVGRPALGVRIRILDDAGQPVPDGEVGRIFVGSWTQFEGYTGGGGKEIIDGLMSTGDVGHLDPAGRLHIDGRDDEMIVSGGENVFPREVEELLATHPGVADVSAIAVTDEEFGQRLRAFCVRREGTEASEGELQEFVRDNLARYKVPREIVFIDELPRNPTGKVLKRELKNWAV